MMRDEIYEKLTGIFREVFDDEEICIGDETVAEDIEGWDSFMHITLMGTVEDEFDMKFTMKDIVSMKNVGQMVDLIEES